MPSENRRIHLTVIPELHRAAGLDPETVGAPDVNELLRKWGRMLQAAAREVAGRFNRAEWNCLADAANGLIWGGVPPAEILAANVADANALEGLGSKWFGEGAGDAAAAALVAKLRALDPIQGEAVAVAIRWFWRQEPGPDMDDDPWWHPAYRAERDRAAAGA